MKHTKNNFILSSIQFLFSIRFFYVVLDVDDIESVMFSIFLLHKNFWQKNSNQFIQLKSAINFFHFIAFLLGLYEYF